MKLGDCYFGFALAGVVLSLDWKENDAREVKLGVLLPWSGSWPLAQRMAEVIPQTIENINRNSSLLRKHNLTFVWRDTQNQASQGLWAMADLWKNERPFVDAIIGPVFSATCEPCGLLAERLNLPMISWGCSSQRLSDKVLYPTFARTKTYGRTNPMNTSLAMASVIRHFRWKRVCLVYSSETAVWTDLALIMNKELIKRDVEVKTVIFTPKTYESILKEKRNKARVFILLCYLEEATQIILTARNLNMTNGDYVFITSDFTMDTTHSNLTALEFYHRHGQVLDGIIDISVNAVDPDEFHMDAKAIKRKMQTPGSAFYSNATREQEVSPFFAYASDAITLYALALNDTLAQGGNITDGRHIAENIFSRTFNGLSGVVSIDDKGDRIPSYSLRNLNNNSIVKIASIMPNGLHLVENRKVVWFGGKLEVPLDQPGCDFENQHCDKQNQSSWTSKKTWIAIPVVSLVLVITMITVLLVYKRRNKIRSLSSVLIRYEDIEMIGCIENCKVTSSFLHSLVDFSVRSDRSSLHIPLEHGAFIGRYKNRQVYVRKLAPHNLYLNHQTIKELFQVQRIVHVNVNPILGVCVNMPNICIISEACSRGSLLDVLSNHDIKLDLTFKMSFATDIASGMKALHASDIRYHGNLTSLNCLVDRTWGCRIADYGLRRLRTEEKKFKGNYASADYKALLWTAPEHILERKRGLFTGSQAGDVYSYGIILNEVFTRNEPFAQIRTLVPVQDVVRRILSSEKPCPLRPPINNDICEKLVNQCWDDDPSIRPQFRTIKDTLRKLNGGRSHRLVDTMLRKMEIYSNNLEELVDERTRQLEAEKARTDELLFEMLPRPVAEQLKAGKSVTAECFEQVTVFFSDIVGFTQLASLSTAIQVVTFLNDLYTYFDNIIQYYDVYKVETIGDAYMVVSGLPERNRDRHAGEIATMALHLLCNIRLFKIRHRPDTHPVMRIGIHSGPCVAGVVGVKKPRYDIFGDTVNVASRMESTGVPNRIHISRECRQLLINLGGYHMERRGEVELKGKGKVITYFLNGKDSFNKTRPDHLESK